MTSPQKRLGKRLRQLRKQRGWTQEKLAQKAGKHWTYIGGIERGERNPTLTVIASLAAAFGVPITDLFREGSRSDGPPS